MTTMATIITDLKTGNTESLYLATDTQIEKLLAANKISEEYVNMFYENQDEMRELMAAAIEEFALPFHWPMLLSTHLRKPHLKTLC